MINYIFELIDTLWNVNNFTVATNAKEFKELIDTLWNVNRGYFQIGDGYKTELIDTLWNVNEVRRQEGK